jgi:hypothetical protein
MTKVIALSAAAPFAAAPALAQWNGPSQWYTTQDGRGGSYYTGSGGAARWQGYSSANQWGDTNYTFHGPNGQPYGCLSRTDQWGRTTTTCR